MKLVYKANGKEYSTLDTDQLALNEAHGPTDQDQDALRGSVMVIAQALGLPPKSVWYLLQNGWSQSLQDSFAGPRAKAKAGDKDNPPIAVDSPEMADIIDSSIVKRLKAIHEGLLSPTPGGGRDPFRTVALQMLQDKAREKGGKLPKDREKRQKMLDTYIAAHKASIEAEIRRRRTDDRELELDDILDA